MPRRQTKAAPRGKNRVTKRRYWSADVMKRSNALDLEPGVFRLKSPQKIAVSLKRSAAQQEAERTPYQSAMSMLTFYINRAGHSLSPNRKSILERARSQLRKVFERE